MGKINCIENDNIEDKITKSYYDNLTVQWDINLNYLGFTRKILINEKVEQINKHPLSD